MNRSAKAPRKATGSQPPVQTPGKAERGTQGDPAGRKPTLWERVRLALMSVVLFLWIAALVALAILTS